MIQIIFILLVLFSSNLPAQAQTPDSVFESLVQKADKAIENWEMKSADFYLARYIGLAARVEAKKSRKDLEGLIQKRKLDPKAFLPGDFDKDFLEWFETGFDAAWGAEEKRVREKYRSVETKSVISENHYFATVVMVPTLESWFTAREGGTPEPMTLAMGSPIEEPLVFCGRVFQEAPPVRFAPLTVKTQKHAVQYFWNPEFFDLDKDGVPELWLRYNLAWGNGFVQVLGIYKIKDENRLVLFKEFRGENEGIARHLKDGKVEVASGSGSRNDIPRMNFDRHRLTVWQYRKNNFHQVSQKEVPHILKSDEWKKYI